MTRSVLGSEDLATVLGSMREGLQIIDRDWRYVYLNDAAATHGRQSKEALLGRTMLECYPGIETTSVFATMRHCMEQHVSSELENRFTYPDGQSRVFELRIAPCDVGILVLSIDVTDGRKVEAQLRHAQKMEAIGRLAGSVAHDFNNMLSVILSYSSLALAELKPVDPLYPDIEAIKRAGERAATLTAQLLAFSRQQATATQVLDLNAIVKESEKMLRRLLGEDIELVTHYERNLPSVQLDPGHVDQVVMNLAVNARDAMPGGGKLTLETRRVTLDEAYAADHFGVKPGEYVMFGMADTGCGMDQETQARIFEPYFTTKDSGRGTGLGLSTVFGIVRQSGGHVWVYSELGKGTTFKVYFPRADQPLSLAPQEVELRSLNGTETILLVEDQDEVRDVAVQILRRYGYHVIEARNAGEALLSCERHPRTIHLLLTDVVMPQVSGYELAQRLLQLRPELKVLYMSGYTDSAVIHHGLIDSGAAYLQKPLLPDALARRVREVLDAK